MLKMVSKSSLLFGFLIVAFLISSKVTARDLAETTDYEAHKEVKGVEDAKYGGYYPGHGGGGGHYGGGGGQYGGGGQHGGGGGQYGGGGGQYGGGGHYGGGGGQYGGGGGHYGGGGGGCHNGCCGHHGYNGCSRCCALNEKVEAKPNN